jgi:hypothetical protein
MSYERMQEEEKRIRDEIRKITAIAAGQDAAEDAEFGPDFRGDELPKEFQRRESRRAVIRAAKLARGHYARRCDVVRAAARYARQDSNLWPAV